MPAHTTVASHRSSPAWAVVVTASAVALLAQLGGAHATAWHFFDEAAAALLGSPPADTSGGLHLYAEHPELQFGPLSILATSPIALLPGPFDELVAMVVGTGIGLLALWMLMRVLDNAGLIASRATLTVASVLFVLVWADVAVRTAHLDDALALVATTTALALLTSGRADLGALSLGLAAAAKPWAIAFAPLVLMSGGGWPAARRLALVGAVALAGWVPFVLADAGTLDTSSFAIDNDPTSVLRALGFDDPTTPRWVRPVQLVGGFVVAAAVVARGRWQAALLAAITWRLLFEPGAHRYYTAGFVIGALVVELDARPHRPPWCTIVAAVALEVTAMPDGPETVARTARALVVVVALLVAVMGRRSASRKTAPTPRLVQR